MSGDGSHNEMSTKLTTEPRTSLHCPVYVDDIFKTGRYQVHRKLGYGTHSKVWLAKDRRLNCCVALKVLKSNPNASSQDMKIWKRLAAESRPHPGKDSVMDLLDSFEHHDTEGIHECFVFNVMGPCIRSYVSGLGYATDPSESRSRQSHADISLSMAKCMLRQVVYGLDFLHKSGVLHNDLHLGNILMSIHPLRSLGENRLARYVEGSTHSLQASYSKCGNSESTNESHQLCTASELHFPRAKRLKTCHAAENFYARDEDRPASSAESSKEPCKPALTHTSYFLPRHLVPPQPFHGTVDYLSPITIKISDMGGAFFLSDPPDHPLTPTTIQSPEMIFGRPVRDSHDIWAFGCLVFELITERALFPRTRQSDVNNDENSRAGRGETRECGDAEDRRVQRSVRNDEHESANGQFGSCQEATTEEGKIEEVHPATSRVPDPKTSFLEQFARKLGPLPLSFSSDWAHASHLFTEDGKAKRRNGSFPWPSLKAHFHEYPTLVDVRPAERIALFDFLRWILQYNPDWRPSAEELLRHPWFLEETEETSDSGSI